MFKRLRKVISISFIAFTIAIVGAVSTLPIHFVSAGVDHYFAMGQLYIENGTGVITEAPIRLATAGANVVHVTTSGTFTVTMANGTSCVVTGDGSGDNCKLKETPVTLAAGANSIETESPTGHLTFTITIGTAANWNTVNSWSLASGGKVGAAVPTSADNVYFDAKSFTAASQVLTVDANAYCLNMDWTGATNTPTLNNPAWSLLVFGNTTFIAAMTTTGGGNLFFIGDTNRTLTTNGLTISFRMASYPSITGKITFLDTVTCTNVFNHYAGTIDTNNQTVTFTTFATINAQAKTFTLGSSIINCTSWDMATGGGAVTLTANTSTINCSGNFSGGGLTTYNNVVLNGSTSTVTGANTYANLSFIRVGGAQTITLPASTTQTVTGTFTATGQTTTNRCTIQSSSAGTNATINAATVAVTKASIKDLIGAGAGNWNMGASSDVLKISGGSGITFRLFWKADTGNWSNIGKWSSVSGATANAVIVPDSVTSVYFDAGSFTAGGQVVAVDASAYCLNMDWTGATNTPTFDINEIMVYYGNLTLIGAMNVDVGATFVCRTAGTSLTTFNGVTMNGVSAYGASTSMTGTLSFQDDIDIGTASFMHGGGTVVTNGNTLTCDTFGETSNVVRTLTLGASTVNCGLWDYSGSNLTLTVNTATINASTSFTGGGITTYYDVNLTGAFSTISGTNTFNSLDLVSTTTQTITFTDGTTQTATTFALSGDATHAHTLQGSGAGGWNLVYTGAATYLSYDYLALTYSQVTPAVNFWYAGANSTDNLFNTGWFFIVPDAPTVTVQAATLIHAEDATGNGTVTNLGAGNFNTLSNGFDWGTITLVYTDSVTGAGSAAIPFAQFINTLPANATIYYRAKAQNSVGWGYSAELSFNTAAIGEPTNLAVNSNGVLTWNAGLYAVGTVVVRGTGAYPATLTDGTEIYNGVGATVTDPNPNPDSVIYYYSAWGYSGVYYSLGYATVTNGGEAMTVLGNNLVLLALLLAAVALTIVEAAKGAHPLGMLGGLLWIFVGAAALSYSTGGNSVMYWLGIAAILAGIAIAVDGGMAFSTNRREARQEREEETRKLSFEEKLEAHNKKRNDERTARKEKAKSAAEERLEKAAERDAKKFRE